MPETRPRGGAPQPPLPGPDAALFLDVDGTLVDIAPTPDAIVVEDGLIPLLRRLHEALSGAVAIVSGRRCAELDAMFGKSGVFLVGEHGADSSGGPSLPRPRRRKLPVRLLSALRRFADMHARTLLEEKGHGAALHVRNAPDAAADAARLATALAAEHGDAVRLLRGKAVFEFVVDGVSKGHAVEALARRAPFRGRRIFVAGDDVTDEDGFAAANRADGVSIRIGRGVPTAARYVLADPARFRLWLARAAEALDPPPRPAGPKPLRRTLRPRKPR